MTQKYLGDWMYKNLMLKKKACISAIANKSWPKDLAKIKSFEQPTNPHLLQQKRAKQPLEDKIFRVVSKIEMQHGVLTDDDVRTKALKFAIKMCITFQTSANCNSSQISHSLANFYAGQRRRARHCQQDETDSEDRHCMY